jgi:hypothetical protein
MTFRTKTSSSKINTRRERECAKGIGSVAKCHPASAALCKAVKAGFFLFGQACSAWRDVIQVAAGVNCFVLRKRVLVHEGDHPAQDLVAGKPSKLNRLVVVVPSREILFPKIVPATDSVPQWNKKPSSGIHSSFSRKCMMLFAPTRARIVLTLFRTPSRLNKPLQKSKCFV